MGWLVPKFSDGGCVGMLVEVRFLSNCTPFLPDEADTPARKRKIGLDPLAVLTQLTIRNGEPLFGAEYADSKQ